MILRSITTFKLLFNFVNLSSLNKVSTSSTINCGNKLKMGDQVKKGLNLKNVIEELENFAPSKSAESWDNVGLLMDPMEEIPISKILLTNDLTEDVVKEAVGLKVGMIISYHPPIFKALKSLTSRTWKERITVQCLKNSIAVYSPHTSWDAKIDGPNEWLIKCLNPKSCEPISETGPGKIFTLLEPLSVQNAVNKIKERIQIPYLRLGLAVGKNMDSKISTVAVCVGAGTTVLAGVPADLYLTGEMLHHDVLDATHNGTHVILCNHSDSERGYLRSIAKHLQDELFKGYVEVIMSEKDRDPLITV